MGEGGGEGEEVAGVAGALGETAGAALDVAYVFEGLAAFGEEEGLGKEGGDEVLAGKEFGEVGGGVEDPVAEFAGPHGGGGAVEGAEEGVLAAGAGVDEVEVLLRGGIDGDLLAEVADGEGAEVVAGAAELEGEVVEDAAGSGNGGVHAGAAEAVEGLDLEVLAEGVVGLVEEEGVAVVGKGAAKVAELLELLVGDEEFGGGEPGEFVLELLAVGELGDGELAGGVVGAGEAPGLLVLEDGGEVVVAAVVEEVEVVDGAGGEDLGDLAIDQLAGDGYGGLLAEGDAFAGLDEFGDVALRGVVGDAAHGDGVAFGEGDVEDAGGDLGVLEEHFVEVAEAVEEEDVVGEGAAQLLILRHHGSEFSVLARGHLGGA